jgi:hypothetical protein
MIFQTFYRRKASQMFLEEKKQVMSLVYFQFTFRSNQANTFEQIPTAKWVSEELSSKA